MRNLNNEKNKEGHYIKQ